MPNLCLPYLMISSLDLSKSNKSKQIESEWLNNCWQILVPKPSVQTLVETRCQIWGTIELSGNPDSLLPKQAVLGDIFD